MTMPCRHAAWRHGIWVSEGSDRAGDPYDRVARGLARVVTVPLRVDRGDVPGRGGQPQAAGLHVHRGDPDDLSAGPAHRVVRERVDIEAPDLAGGGDRPEPFLSQA